MKKWFAILTSLALATSCAPSKEEQNNPSSLEVAAKHLTIPWQLNRAQNDLWISERTGGIILIGPNHKKTSYTLEFSSVLPDGGEGGFLGFLLDPKYEQNKKAYAYYTYKEQDKLINRIVVLTFTDGQWKENRILLDGIPGGLTHNGGRMEWGPDQKLYITTGDSGKEELAQDINSLAGKILRINADGTIPEDNPFYPSPVYTYGHRNPQGMTWDEKGEMYAAEHGSSHYDEVNKIKAGKNYGWPEIRGDERKQGMESPWMHSGNDTWAPSGIQYHDGAIYAALLRGEAVLKINTSSKKTSYVLNNQGRIRDILIVEKGMYILTNNTDGRGQPSNDDDRLLYMPLDK
ncbi:PQQ-dependent sugar dehydrogenase [Fictibacillus nanhaiensis]|uniref:PQQ-dependent sugar dehydrogenase n=1 Tax=Fictibacillus nanhaiensis TaxID=742169 RepID=UPI001C96436D|nr:PQQ-dependent sugar dehydrogenase [Fictibacillus nanhaiensis]MBY6036754.1 PQQ-dependent sugar dehydrogenase [Fictibacillus nanhaiensis]